jgi:hypothetical protein
MLFRRKKRISKLRRMEREMKGEWETKMVDAFSAQ